MARVPLMPTIQSASERLKAASARGCMSWSSRSSTKPLRMASGVMDWSHSRLMGFLALAWRTMLRKISSPSRPASQAFTRASTSLRLISLTSVFSRDAFFWMGLRSK